MIYPDDCTNHSFSTILNDIFSLEFDNLLTRILYLKDNKMVFDQEGIEDIVVNHFKGIFNGQTIPITTDFNDLVTEDEVNVQSPLTEDEFEKEVCSPYSTSELDEILDKLPVGKASSTDNIPNELLKNTNTESRIYIKIFLDKIMQNGEVPEDLNQGKCVLIYKVLMAKKNNKF